MASDGLTWPGMSTCYTYFGRAHAVFAAHAEDHNLPSVNQLVWGAPKVWYAVPGEHFRAASDALRACFSLDENSEPGAVARVVSLLYEALQELEA